MVVLVIQNAGLLKILWSSGTRAWLNVLGLQGSPVLPVFDQTLANNIQQDVNGAATTSGLGPLLAPSVQLTGITIRDISAANRPEIPSLGGPISGTGVGDMLPLNVAAVATMRTAGAGKSFRGRAYFSGFTETQNDVNGRTATAVNSAIVSFLTTLNTSLTARSLHLAVLSRPRDARVIPERTIAGKAGFATAMTVALARNTKWESQRRRTGKS